MLRFHFFAVTVCAEYLPIVTDDWYWLLLLFHNLLVQLKCVLVWLMNETVSCHVGVFRKIRDQPSPGRRSIGTSCSDLETNNIPIVVETCQICTLFHPKVAAEPARKDNKGSLLLNTTFIYCNNLLSNLNFLESCAQTICIT